VCAPASRLGKFGKAMPFSFEGEPSSEFPGSGCRYIAGQRSGVMSQHYTDESGRGPPSTEGSRAGARRGSPSTSGGKVGSFTTVGGGDVAS